MIGWTESFGFGLHKVYDDLIRWFDVPTMACPIIQMQLLFIKHLLPNISSRSRLNPEWNEDNVDKVCSIHEGCSKMTLRRIGNGEYKFTWFDSSGKTCCKNLATCAWISLYYLCFRFDVHASGKILLFNTFCSWKIICKLWLCHSSGRSDIPSKMSWIWLMIKKSLYVIYQDYGNQWRAVPQSLGLFSTGKLYPNYGEVFAWSFIYTQQVYLDVCLCNWIYWGKN
jgi:hypothetical protein